MWGRFEGKKGIRIALLSAILFLYPNLYIRAQELPQWLISAIEEIEYSTEGASEQLYDYFYELLRNPLDINNCSREDLESLVFMDPFQIEGILDYRNDYGAILTPSELSLIDGFGEQFAKNIAPFFIFGNSPSSQDKYSRISGKWETRLKYPLKKGMKYPLKGALPFTIASKFVLDIGENGSLWSTMESDAGENIFPDFISLGVSVDNIPILRNRLKIRRIVCGDYSLRLSQGVMLWNSFSISSAQEPSSMIKRGALTLHPYRSTSEGEFFRGAAIFLEWKEMIDLTLFYSNNMVDAKIEGDSFVSLPTDGLHDTENKLLNRNTLNMEMVGGDIGFFFEGFKVGARWSSFKYPLEDRRKRYEYNKYQKFEGWNTSFGVDLFYSVGGVRCVAEVALDKELDLGAMATVVAPLGDGLEAGLSLRYFDCKLSLPSKLYNECGALISVKWSPSRKILCSGNFSYTYSPLSRYRVKGDSHRAKGICDFSWMPDSAHKLSCQLSASYDSGFDLKKYYVKATYQLQIDSSMTISSRIHCSYSERFGILSYIEGKYGWGEGLFSLLLRATAFNVPSWDSRIYTYERDIPGSFSVPAYYGTGVGGYLYFRYRPKRWIDVNFRCGGTLYKDPSKNYLKFSLGVSLLF